MLSPAVRKLHVESTIWLVESLGLPCTLLETRPPKRTAASPMGFRIAGKQDQEIISQYGEGTRILTILAKYHAFPPIKNDQVRSDSTGETFTLKAVHPISDMGEFWGWKAYAQGY